MTQKSMTRTRTYTVTSMMALLSFGEGHKSGLLDCKYERQTVEIKTTAPIDKAVEVFVFVILRKILSVSIESSQPL